MSNREEKDEIISVTQAKSKALGIHSMLASFIVIVGALFVFLNEGTEKKLGVYIIILGITYSFITRFRIWRNNK